MAEDTQNTIEKKARIEISETSMEAYLVFDDPVEGNIQVPEAEINNLLISARVKHGIKHDEIFEISLGKREGNKLLIAEGTKPQPGKDATFEFLFPTDRSFRPKILDDGRIDYKEVNVVKSVVKDQVLIKKTPSTQGIKGMNVLGNELFAFPGKNIDITVGAGVYKDKNDPNIIKSSVDGIILYDENRRTVEVQKLYLVPKVDYSTGNINVKSSVEVNGDVKPYFTITTPYDVQVKGLVDNASVNCGGSLSVLGGITGDGKQTIIAGIDIHSAYINNQKVKCGGNVYINSEIRNSVVDCSGEIMMVKDTGVIIGGVVAATNKITVGVVGNSYYVHTELHTGVKMEHREKYQQKVAEKKAITKKIEELKEEIKKAEESLTAASSNSKVVDSLYGRLDECNAIFEKLTRDIKEIEIDYYNVAEPSIQVQRKIYPGAIIRIKNQTYEVKEEMGRVLFKLEAGSIVCKNN